MSPLSALRIDDLAVAFDDEIVLDGVTGTVAPGESLALIGPNGAGKSTLIRAILGLVEPVRGSLTVLGVAPAEARLDVAYVPQSDVLDSEFPISVAQVVLMGRYRRIGWLRRPQSSDRATAMAALEQVGLASRASDRFGVLSGGQRQRVLIARAIAQQAKLLLLDEPFNGVDSTTQELIVEVLAQLRADGVAIVMATHDLSVAHLACSDACLLNRHQIAFGPIVDALTAETLQVTYGGHAVELAGGSTIVLPHGH